MERLYFFENIHRLKEKQRKVWLMYGVKNPETIASHIFRMTILAWILGLKRKGLNMEKVIKLCLINNLCKVFSQEQTIFDPLLPKNIISDRKKTMKIIETWPKLSLEQKKQKARRKNQTRTRAFKKLISDLPPSFKKEMENVWFELEETSSKEARFVKQADKAENLLQAFEYWKKQKEININIWLRWADVVFEDPLFLDFKKALERKFIKKGKKQEMDKILDFLIKIGELKSKQKKRYSFKQVFKTETIAEHSFSIALMAWLFAKGKKFEHRKVLKIALVHGMAGCLRDNVFYYALLANFRNEIKRIIKKSLIFSFKKRKEILLKIQKLGLKEKRFHKEYKKVRDEFKKLISPLDKQSKEELLRLWDQYNRGLSKEGNFVQQITILDDFIQAARYYKKNKKFLIDFWFNEIGKDIDDSSVLSFIEVLCKAR